MTLIAKPPLVEIRNLTKRFGDRVAVKNFDLCIYPGECLGLLGPNGAGKTTTIYMLLGLVRSTSGEISIFEKSKIENRCGTPGRQPGSGSDCI